eukprot:4527357-Pleurochrysis_carterae.AAC.4
MARIEIGTDCGVVPCMNEVLERALDQWHAGFIVVPLVHPRNRRDPRRPRPTEPFTRSDLVLHSAQWSAQVWYEPYCHASLPTRLVKVALVCSNVHPHDLFQPHVHGHAVQP